MKIIHIVESTATGTLSMVKGLANGQSDRGYDVTVIYSKRSETPNNLISMFSENIKLINVQMLSWKNKIRSVMGIRRIVNSQKNGIVFMHSSYAGFIGRIALLGISVKCFYIPHCISFMRKDTKYIYQSIFILFECVGAIKNCDYIACSKSEFYEIKKRIPFRKCHLIENAVDITGWKYKIDWSLRKNLVVTVGQIRDQKDPLRFAKICELSKSRGLDFEFIWVGDGKDQVLKDALTKAGVKILGWKSPHEIGYILNKSKVYLSTALWEGLPISPIEAMLSGCTALLSNCSGNIDIIGHRKNGFVFSNSDNAVELLKEISCNEHFASKVSIEGAIHCKSRFNFNRYIDEMTTLINMES